MAGGRCGAIQYRFQQPVGTLGHTIHLEAFTFQQDVTRKLRERLSLAIYGPKDT
jgi:hypothetical protein